MAYTDTPGDVVRVTLAVLYPTNVQVQEVNLNFINLASGGGDSRAGLLNTIVTATLTNLQSTISSINNVYGGVLHTVNVTPAPAPVTNVVAVLGTGGPDTLPSQARAIITWRTALSGRKYRGRNFMFTPDTTSITAGGEPSVAYKLALQAWANAVKAPIIVGGSTWQLCIYHRPVTGHPITAPTVILSGAPSGKFGTQRKGGDYGRANPLVPF